MTSIKDVAREVSLSTATVSRALRGLRGVSDENRTRVTEAAQRLGYVPSPSAVGLASGQTNMVAVIVPHVSRWFFGEVVQGAEEVLRAAGYDLLLYNLAGEPAARHRVFQTGLLSKRVDAVLVLGLRPTAQEQARLAQLGRPVAIVGAAATDLYSVSIDDELAARLATTHLVDLGHRRIGYVGGSLDTLDYIAPSARLAGYRAVLRERGIRHYRELEDVGEFTVAGGGAAARRLLTGPERPTAIFAASDEMAIGVLRATRELGLSVPGDLSVVGIDDYELAEFFDLTTVAQPVREQGRRGAERVLAELLGVRRRTESEVLPVELVVRASTAPPATER
ncbi:LacI family DNA-binding transcriptional regulator [Nocardioides panacihumi]|uniref:LacI family DNA-binding transcriptional regulator n=1 Tax=Nocardioides panacihumi TaxID=400774 RepID=A0ABN2RBZ4_9ACTN